MEKDNYKELSTQINQPFSVLRTSTETRIQLKLLVTYALFTTIGGWMIATFLLPMKLGGK